MANHTWVPQASFDLSLTRASHAAAPDIDSTEKHHPPQVADIFLDNITAYHAHNHNISILPSKR